MITGPRDQITSFHLTRQTKEAMRQHVAKENLSMSYFISKTLTEKLKELGFQVEDTK